MARITEEQIRKAIGSVPTLASYCNELQYSEVELMNELSGSKTSVESMLTMMVPEVNMFDMQPSIFKANGCEYAVFLKIEYDIAKERNSAVFILEKQGYDSFITRLTQFINNIIEGNKAVSALNGVIGSIQNEYGTQLIIKYVWGDEKYCSVKDWDYDRVDIELSKSAVKQLIELHEHNKIEEAVKKDRWDKTIVQYIEGFSSINIHKEIDAVLNTSVPADALCYNMIDKSMIPRVVKATIETNKNKEETNGTQSIKTLNIINELGQFAVICVYEIDYSKHTITSEIPDRKVYDLEGDRVITDINIVDRIDTRMKLSKELISVLFE